MGFQENLLKVLQSNFSPSRPDFAYNFQFPRVQVPKDTEDSLPVVQAYGSVKALFPYCCELSVLAFYCLLYTESGMGILTSEALSYPLGSNTLAFLDCRERHRIEIKQAPWHYKIFFITGTPLPFLYKNYRDSREIVHTFAPGSAFPDKIGKFYGHLSQQNENYLVNAKFILDILLGTALEKEKAEDTKNLLPVYVKEIKKSFDENYGSKFTLDCLEKKYQISKYQICREFSLHFGISPIQYLNNMRIAAAKEALVHSDKRINEIGRMVSFENTNHFIRLFKQKTGVTPLSYRKAASYTYRE